jgi:hypothetical protein
MKAVAFLLALAALSGCTFNQVIFHSGSDMSGTIDYSTVTTTTTTNPTLSVPLSVTP